MRYIRDLAFSRFVIAGGVNALSTYLIYVACLLVMAYPYAYTLAYGAGVVISYILNALFVFHTRLRWDKLLQFPLVYAVQYLVGLAGLFLLTELLGLPAAVAPLIVLLATIPLTFVLSRFVLTVEWPYKVFWRRPRTDPPGNQERG